MRWITASHTCCLSKNVPGFPIINANLYIKTPHTAVHPYKILRMDGMNILFIGIITQDVINQTKSESLVGSFVDTAAAAAEVGKICNAHNSIDIRFYRAADPHRF